jgi:hypothetical protein
MGTYPDSQRDGLHLGCEKDSLLSGFGFLANALQAVNFFCKILSCCQI